MTSYQKAYVLDKHKKCIQQQQIQKCGNYCSGCPWEVDNRMLIEALNEAINGNLEKGLVYHNGGYSCM